jgi:hypothetical protein
MEEMIERPCSLEDDDNDDKELTRCADSSTVDPKEPLGSVLSDAVVKVGDCGTSLPQILTSIQLQPFEDSVYNEQPMDVDIPNQVCTFKFVLQPQSPDGTSGIYCVEH